LQYWGLNSGLHECSGTPPLEPFHQPLPYFFNDPLVIQQWIIQELIVQSLCVWTFPVGSLVID
jgi:hypothetical protein